MKKASFSAGSLAALALAGCSAGTGSLGTNVGFSDAETDQLAQENRIILLQVAEGTTTALEIPTINQATYNGFVHGYTGGSLTGPDLVYYGDLAMTADFDTETVSGSISDVYTDLAGFLSPSGSATVTGTFDNTVAGGNIDIAATGSFVGTHAQADMDFDGSGDFIGDTAGAVIGTHTTDFDWTTGANAGGTSFSDGDWTGEE